MRSTSVSLSPFAVLALTRTGLPLRSTLEAALLLAGTTGDLEEQVAATVASPPRHGDGYTIVNVRLSPPIAAVRDRVKRRFSNFSRWASYVAAEHAADAAVYLQEFNDEERALVEARALDLLKDLSPSLS
jgi:cephalosporin-C deacetylase-like acetyl esterase